MKTNTALIFIAALLGSCVQETHLKTVTFKVDMSQVENTKNVGLRGQMTNPPWQVTIPMTDEDKDSIYEVTLTEKTAANSFQFKFVKDDEDYELKGLDNRMIRFEYKSEMIVYEARFDNTDEKQRVAGAE